MKTKITEGDLHLKEKRYCFVNDKVMPVKTLSGKLRVIHDCGTTYVVCPIDTKCRYEGIMIPIMEDYASLKEIK